MLTTELTLITLPPVPQLRRGLRAEEQAKHSHVELLVEELFAHVFEGANS